MATNAARYRMVAGKNIKLLEFGLRRAQGPDGGLSASKYSYIGKKTIVQFDLSVPLSSGFVRHHEFISIRFVRSFSLFLQSRLRYHLLSKLFQMIKIIIACLLIAS